VLQIREHWPELSIQYCENPELGDAPYRIVENCGDGVQRGVLAAWELDGRLLEVLHQADTSKHDVQKIMEKGNNAARLANSNKSLYWRDYCRDVITTAAKHMGTSFTFKDPRPDHEGEIVKIDDDPTHRTLGL